MGAGWKRETCLLRVASGLKRAWIYLQGTSEVGLGRIGLLEHDERDSTVAERRALPGASARARPNSASALSGDPEVRYTRPNSEAINELSGLAFFAASRISKTTS